MRKFKQFPSAGLWLRSLFILTGAFALLAAFTPRASADLVRFYDFEGTATPPYPVNLQSHSPALETGAGTTLLLRDENGNPYPAANTLVGPPLINLPPGAAPNTTSLGVSHTHQHNLNIDIPFPSSQGIYNITSMSFAYLENGNGYSQVLFQISTNGGVTFQTLPGGTIALPNTGVNGAVISLTIANGTTLNINNLVLRLSFVGGQSNGNNLEFAVDNIQIGGTIVPEPATVAAGLLGVLGLCWFQRRRLMRSLRFGKA